MLLTAFDDDDDDYYYYYYYYYYYDEPCAFLGDLDVIGGRGISMQSGIICRTIVCT